MIRNGQSLPNVINVLRDIIAHRKAPLKVIAAIGLTQVSPAGSE